MIELAVNNLEKYLDSNKIFDNITFNIYDGERVGIVGDNGCGKTTLLKILCGKLEINSDDKGSIFITKNSKISYLDQMVNFDSKSKVSDVLNLAFKHLENIELKMYDLEKKMNELKGEELDRALKEYNKMQEFYEAHDGYKKEVKLNRICKGLKINEDFYNKDFELLSGGEKTIVALGKILLENPDILLLDEPTNHLDMESCEWLESFLKSYKGIVIIVSHDRYFLDNVVNKIIEIEDKTSETYKGNYSQYIKEKEENMLIEFNKYKEQQKKIEAMEKAIKRLREWAKQGDNVKFIKRAASMQKALDKIQTIDKPKFEKDKMKLKFNESERSGNEVLNIKFLNKSFEDKVLFKDAKLNIKYKDRVGIIGKNGCGKTTLLKMILNEDKNYDGDISIGSSVKLAYLPQNIKFENEEDSVLDEFRKDFTILDGKAREYLSKFMFYGSDVYKKIKHLSGGERIRLKLSEMLYSDINLLILDEPTNHLDISSIETLEDALDNFKGTIVFISHDRYFLNKMSSRIVAVEDSKLNSYVGNYDNYKNLSSFNNDNFENAIKDNYKENENKTKDEWIEKKNKEKEEKKNKNKILKLEEYIEDIENKIKIIEEEMMELGADYEKIRELSLNKKNLELELNKKISEWEALSSK